MKKKNLKFLAVLSLAAAICVTGITLSQNNEYKKFLELNKKALAEDKEHMFDVLIKGKCSDHGMSCHFLCPVCGYKSNKAGLGTIYDIHGICPGCNKIF